MDAESLARLKRNLHAATDDALVALANRGLLRRAAKDLEAETLRVELGEKAVFVHGNGWVVTMPPEGPSGATDNTPATGITRQILAAAIYLRDRWQVEEAMDSAAESPATSIAGTGDRPPVADVDESALAAKQLLVDAPPGELFKWAGKTPVLEAAAMIESVGPVTIVEAPLLKVEFAEAEVSVVLMTDRPAKTLRKLLDQFKATSQKAQQAKWVMLAVLAIKRAAGQSIAIDSDDASALSEAVREDRQRIAVRTAKLLSAFAAAGVAHPSSRIVERFHTASVAAEAARHPRLARLLHSIADDAELQLARSAAADPSRMLQRIVVAHALAEATAKPENAQRVDLFGRQRSTYTPAGNLELCGLGAYGWRTASGYEGVTSIFWDVRQRRFLTATSARGEGQDRTFTLRGAYESGLGWSGGSSIETMCRRQFELSGAKLNPDGRLSLAESCKATLGALTNPAEIDFGDRATSDWSELSRVIRHSQPLGLRTADPTAALVIARPAAWGARWFDELEQSFVWQLIDSHGASVEVRVPWSDVTESAVMFLEALLVDRDKPAAILGRIGRQGAAWRIFPLSVFSSGTPRGDLILCPQFDQGRISSVNEALLRRLREKYQRFQTVQTRIGSDEEDEESLDLNEASNWPPLLRTLVVDAETVLFSALETSASGLTEPAARALAEARDRFAALGLALVANELNHVLTQRSPQTFLRAAYHLHLLRQAATLCA